MFLNKNEFSNTDSIADSKMLIWKRSKIYNVYEYYSLYRSFQSDKRKSKSPSKY